MLLLTPPIKNKLSLMWLRLDSCLVSGFHPVTSIFCQYTIILSRVEEDKGLEIE